MVATGGSNPRKSKCTGNNRERQHRSKLSVFDDDSIVNFGFSRRDQDDEWDRRRKIENQRFLDCCQDFDKMSPKERAEARSSTVLAIWLVGFGFAVYLVIIWFKYLEEIAQPY